MIILFASTVAFFFASEIIVSFISLASFSKESLSFLASVNILSLSEFKGNLVYVDIFDNYCDMDKNIEFLHLHLY